MFLLFGFLQLDFALWVPNCPTSMVRPPPQVKGVITEDDILGFLPDVNITCRVLMVLSMLSQPSSDFVRLQTFYLSFSSGNKTNFWEMYSYDIHILPKIVCWGWLPVGSNSALQRKSRLCSLLSILLYWRLGWLEGRKSILPLIGWFWCQTMIVKKKKLYKIQNSIKFNTKSW